VTGEGEEERYGHGEKQGGKEGRKGKGEREGKGKILPPRSVLKVGAYESDQTLTRRLRTKTNTSVRTNGSGTDKRRSAGRLPQSTMNALKGLGT